MIRREERKGGLKRGRGEWKERKGMGSMEREDGKEGREAVKEGRGGEAGSLINYLEDMICHRINKRIP